MSVVHMYMIAVFEINHGVLLVVQQSGHGNVESTVCMVKIMNLIGGNSFWSIGND